MPVHCPMSVAIPSSDNVSMFDPMGTGLFGAGHRPVAWQDLVMLRRIEVARELLLPLPWLGISLVLANFGFYLLALPFSFAFFLAGLRVVHGGCHHALGLP